MLNEARLQELVRKVFDIFFSSGFNKTEIRGLFKKKRPRGSNGDNKTENYLVLKQITALFIQEKLTVNEVGTILKKVKSECMGN